MNNGAVFNLDRTKVSYYIHGEEQHGIERANSRTHKQFLRKNKLGKFKKRQAK